MPSHVCPQCGLDFYHRKSARTFCGRDCWVAWNKRHPNAGTFTPNVKPVNWLPLGTETTRERRGRSEGPRVWVKVAEPNVWKLRAVLTWEAANGPLPRGYVVHHRNRDTLDDSIENLEAISRSAHLREHRHEFESRRARSATAARWG